MNGQSLTLRLTGTFAAAPHSLRLAWYNDLNSATLGSGTFPATAAGGVIELTAALKATPGVYRIQADLDGAPFSTTRIYIPGIERDGGDLYMDGQPFSAFAWTWRGLDYVFKKDGGRFANINVDNLMRPVADGGFGFNCVFSDSLWTLKPSDFTYLDKVGGHVCVITCVWEGLDPGVPRSGIPASRRTR